MAKKKNDTVENQVENVVENQEVVEQTTETVVTESTQEAPESTETEMTDEEKRAQYEEEQKKKAEEAAALAEALKVDIGRRCKVVPFNTITWVDGTVVGTIHDKRSNKVMYAIKTDDGRRIVKAHGSELLQLLEETVEVVKKTRTKSEGPKMTEEEYNALEEKWANCVGHQVMYLPHKATEKVEGKITSIVPDAESRRLLLKIEGIIDEKPKVSHKTCMASDIEVLDTVDEEFKASFLKRREVRLEKAKLTPEQKIEQAEANVKKALENIEKAQKAHTARVEELEKLKAEYEASQTEKTADAPEGESQETGDDDLS